MYVFERAELIVTRTDQHHVPSTSEQETAHRNSIELDALAAESGSANRIYQNPKADVHWSRTFREETAVLFPRREACSGRLALCALELSHAGSKYSSESVATCCWYAKGRVPLNVREALLTSNLCDLR
eukprot:2927043-Pleurochrysis_carterae.AAC.1